MTIGRLTPGQIGLKKNSYLLQTVLYSAELIWNMLTSQGIFSNDYMCIYCGGQVKKDNTIDLECSNDVLNGTTEDEITDWLKNTKNVGATDFCFNGTHTDLVMSSCFCPPGESFRKVRSTLSPLRPDIFICRFCVILNRRWARLFSHGLNFYISYKLYDVLLREWRAFNDDLTKDVNLDLEIQV